MYAIANVFELCHGGFNNVPEEKLTWEFRRGGLRSHLIKILFHVAVIIFHFFLTERRRFKQKERPHHMSSKCCAIVVSLTCVPTWSVVTSVMFGITRSESDWRMLSCLRSGHVHNVHLYRRA